MANLDSMSKVFALSETQKRTMAAYLVDTIQGKQTTVRPEFVTDEDAMLFFGPALHALIGLSSVAGMMGHDEWLHIQEETGSERFHEISVVVYSLKATAVYLALMQSPNVAISNMREETIGEVSSYAYLASLDLKIEGINRDFTLFGVEDVLALDISDLEEAVAVYNELAIERLNNLPLVTKLSSEP